MGWIRDEGEGPVHDGLSVRAMRASDAEGPTHDGCVRCVVGVDAPAMSSIQGKKVPTNRKSTEDLCLFILFLLIKQTCKNLVNFLKLFPRLLGLINQYRAKFHILLTLFRFSKKSKG